MARRRRHEPAQRRGDEAGVQGTLAEAVRHHQAGRLDRAEALYGRVLEREPGNADALHFLGLVAHARGDHATALERLREAIRRRGDAATYHNNLGSVLLGLGRAAEAEASYRRAVELRPDYAEAHCNLGASLYEQGRIDGAEAACRRALGLNPDYAEAHNTLGNALRERGAVSAAEAAFRRALAISPGYAEAHNNLGNALQERGALDEAEASYRRALELRPDYAEAHCNLGNALEAGGRLGAAADSHRAAIRARPDYARSHAELAGVQQEDGRTEEAEAGYRRALECDGGFAPAHAGLATLWEKASRLEEAAAAAADALDLDPGNLLATLVAAKCARRAGDVEGGLGRLGALDRDALDAPSRAAVCFELGNLYDRSADYASAYEAFAEGNRYSAEHWRARHSDAQAYPRQIERLAAAFRPAWVASWTPSVPETSPPPAFLVGFPRSGTTLLERILDAHPRLVSLEEKPAISAVVARLEALPGGYPEALAGLSADDIESLRGVYWDEVAPHLGEPKPGVGLVDKLPLNMTDAGLIHRLFPTAKFVFALRHPCDVVLSGFMQPFQPNRAMVHFATLEDTARLYARAMGLWRQYAEVLPLDHHAVRYEDVVADARATTRSVLAFLGVAWDDAVLEYWERPRQWGSATPSYHQVAQPIYARSVGRWTNYRVRLEPVLPLLAPFIAAFGYQAR